MNIKRPLMPGFLKKAEQKLLLNKPGAWSTRTHLVLYYGLLFMLFLATLCFLERTDLRDYSTTDHWVGFVCIIAVIALTVWMIYLLRFNVFKKYGSLHPLHALTTFLMYFISAGVIVLFTFVHPVVESVRANLAYSDEEIVKDINAINLKVCQLEINQLNIPWVHDTLAIVNEKATIQYRADELDDTTVAMPGYPFARIDTAEFRQRRYYTDSIVKINDTLYDMYKTPDYAFITSGNANRYARQQLLSAFDLFNKVFRHPQQIDKAAISKELGVLLHKYNYEETLESYVRTFDIEKDDGPFRIVEKKYHLGSVQNGINNIVSKKYYWSDEDLAGYVRVFYYVTLVITLLIFIFRHTTIKTFFLSMLTGLLLTIFTALILSFLHGDELTFLTWLIVYTILFFLGSLTAWVIKKRNVITGILMNLFVFIVPVFPILIFAWYYAWKAKQIEAQKYLSYYNKLEDYISYAEIGGVVLLLILLATYIGKVYRRWYALPEE
jgi:hypothetical protein